VLEIDEEWAVAEALWSPDGEWFIHRTSTNVRGAGDIVGLRKSQGDARIPLLASGFTETEPAISPTGKWMAYASNETGRTEVFVVPFPNTGDARWLVSVGVLFSDVDYLRSTVRRQYEVSPDGERFVMIRPVGAGREIQLILVHSFFEELRRIGPS